MSREKIIAHQRDLLTKLRGHLTALHVPTFLTADHNGQPCLEITDHNARTRRVYVQVVFYWFYWGDLPDERTSTIHLPMAAEDIAAAVRRGWREGEQGTFSINLGNIHGAHGR